MEDVAGRGKAEKMCLEGSLTEPPETAVTFVFPLQRWARHRRSDPIMDRNGCITGLNIECVMHVQMRRSQPLEITSTTRGWQDVPRQAETASFVSA